jgi:alpha-glucoside transport system substrate-binding protein
MHTLFKRSPWLLLSLIAILALVAVAACGDDDDDDGDDGGTSTATGTGEPVDIGEVEVLGIWGDQELTNWEAMVAPWEADTGGSMAFTGDREITTILGTRVEGGSPPDVAIPAEVGLFQQYASEGQLAPLSDCDGLEELINSQYPQSFVDLGTVDGTLYGFFMKADTKGTVWYDPAFFSDNSISPLDASASFDDLIGLSDDILATGTPPWSMGQEAGGGTGFPGSDFIQQIYLNEYGGDMYDGIIDGSVPYNDASMKDTWEKFGEIALTDGFTVQGSGQTINATNFTDSVYPPFEDPPEAGMVYMGAFAAGFITEQFPDAVAETDYDFFDFPGGGATGGANIVYAFNMNDSVCSFLKYIASAEAQQIWVDLGGFTSVNTGVSVDSYPDPVAQKAAEQLLNAPEFRFDQDDAIGGAMQGAIFDGIVAYLNNPDDLDDILDGIESARD